MKGTYKGGVGARRRGRVQLRPSRIALRFIRTMKATRRRGDLKTPSPVRVLLYLYFHNLAEVAILMASLPFALIGGI
jgi:hypothetical protein